jgi:type II secretory pathway pseudopilin PulG
VIAVLSVLAAILFPVFAQVREKARQATCLSNLKQLSLSVPMYAQDYDETYPIWSTTEWTPPARTVRWDYLVHPYVKNIGIYKCPSAAKRYAGAVSTFGYNRQLGERVVGSGPTSAKSFTAIPEGYPVAGVPSPASVVLLFDMDPEIARGFEGGNATPWMRVVSRSYHADNTFDQMHSDGDNIAFTDGHAKWGQTRTLLELYQGQKLIIETWEARRISFDRTYQP